MKYFVIFVALAVAVAARPQLVEEPEELPTPPKYYQPTEVEIKQNEAAKYQFSTNIDDHINDLTNQRSEVRDGLAVKGMYSYSDGFVKRTVYYEADDKGYRVTRTEILPLEDGPKIDLAGTASVQAESHGNHVNYQIKSVPVEGPVSRIIDNEYISAA